VLSLSPFSLSQLSCSLSVICFCIWCCNKSVKMSDSTATCIDILLAIILPPLGVFLKFGCQVEFWICLLLTLFGWIPGIIYAIYIITK
ncbi:YqaE/Pmp3 family membrane protein, partial [Klebsiella pneumoniae]